MTLSPRVTLALLLAAGLAAPALAQTTPQPAMSPSSGEASWNSQHPGSSYATQPQAMQPGMSAQPQASNSPALSIGPTSPNAQPAGMQPNPNGQMPPMPSSQANAAGPTGSSMPGSENERVSQAQAQLRAAGLYNGPQDGVMDPDTRAAIARFQEQHRLPRTERLDPRTVSALTGNQTMGSGSSTSMPTPAMPNGSEGQTSAPPSAGGMSGNMAPTQPPQH